MEFRHNRYDLPNNGICTFFKKPICYDLDHLDADVAILGLPFEEGNNCRAGTKMAPHSVREASILYGDEGHPVYDFEMDRHFMGPDFKIVDCGDVDVISGSVEKSIALIEEAVAKIAARGVFPVGVGGDDTIPIPFAKALLRQGPLYVVQIDAHLDWTESLAGQKISHSTNMRRISEMEGCEGIAQVCVRGVGSSQKSDFDAARAFGTVIVSAREFKRIGPEAVLARIPDGKRYYLNLDIDGMDPSICPGTTTPAPGGLSYYEAYDFMQGLAQKGEMAGMTVNEVNPLYDAGTTTSIMAARLMLDMIQFVSIYNKKYQKTNEKE